MVLVFLIYSKIILQKVSSYSETFISEKVRIIPTNRQAPSLPLLAIPVSDGIVSVSLLVLLLVVNDRHRIHVIDKQKSPTTGALSSHGVVY